jgi:hypothetical protein
MDILLLELFHKRIETVILHSVKETIDRIINEYTIFTLNIRIFSGIIRRIIISGSSGSGIGSKLRKLNFTGESSPANNKLRNLSS